MKPRRLQQTCGWSISRSFSKKVRQLNITRKNDRCVLVEFLVAFATYYHGILTSWGIEEQLYQILITCLRNRLNPPVFLTAMLVYCPKVTIDQIAMVAERRHSVLTGSGLYLSQDECRGMMQVITEYQKQQSHIMHTLGEDIKSFILPTKCLVLEGIYFLDSKFLPDLLAKMPDLHHISLQYNGTQGVMKSLSKHCKYLESLCFLEPGNESSLLENDIFQVLFGIPSTIIKETDTLLPKFASDKNFRDSFVFQFPNLRKLDIDELFFDEDIIHDIYTLTLLLHPKLMCFGKLIGLTKRMLKNYKKIWSIMNNRPEKEAVLHISEGKFVDPVSDVPSNGSVELSYWGEVSPLFENIISVELQKSNFTEKDVAEFCLLFSKKVKTFSLGELPLSDMSCLHNVTHLRLTLRRHYSFDKMHLILDNCPSLQTLSIHPTFYDEISRINGGLNHLVNVEQMMEEDMEMFERLMFAEVMAQEANVLPAMFNRVHNEIQELLFPRAEEAPPPFVGDEPRPAMWTSKSKKEASKHNNLTVLRIASLCEAGQSQSEVFLEALLERLPNLRNLCLGMWMGSLSQRREYLTCTATALVNVVTDKKLKKPILPVLTQLCCLPTGNETEICQSLASLVEALPSLQTLVLPALDNFMLAPTLRYFQHSNLDIQYKCATDQVFSYWEPEH